MSIYDSQGNNNKTIRSKNIMCDSIRRLNKITGHYEEIVSGGGSVELPYYLYGDQIKFSGTDLNLNGFYMNAVNQSIDDLDAICTENLNRIIPLESEQVVQNNKISAVEAVNVTQGNKISALETKTFNVNAVTNSSINFGYSSSPGPKFQLDNGGLKVYAGPSSSAQYPQIKIDATSIAFATSSSSSVFLDVTRIDKMAKILQVVDSVWDTNLSITKPLLLTGTTSVSDVTNKKMMVIDNTTKTVSYTNIPSSNNIVVLSHTPSLVDTVNSGTIIAESSLVNSNEYTGDVSLVRKYNMSTATEALLELTVTTAFDISSGNTRSKNIIFFKDDADYNASTGLINKEKLNLSITYLPSKDDINSEFISVRMKPFPIRKNYPVSGDQYALGRMIVIEKNIPTEVTNKAVQLRGKFLIKKHVSTGFFGEMNYGWTE